MKSHRIGFTLASIHTGSSQSLWSSIADHAASSSDYLFIFPLGRLECEEDNEAMRSSVAPLVNGRNIDGLISWASALCGIVSKEDVIEYHREHFSALPFVTIGLKCPGHAEISFDAYDGFKSAVQHLIKVHGKRKIAYVRGPENHESSQDRFRAYLDALKESGITIDDRLISSPFSWSQGEDAIKELCEKRGLEPGKDFDALCSASDLMMLSAGRYLEKKGIRIPKDLALAGFNNSSESQLLRVPCTTVSMPYERMGIMAYTLIKGILNSEDGVDDCPDVMLPAELVIRRSCGCSDSFGGREKALETIKDKASFIEWANRIFCFKEEEKILFEKAMNLSFGFPLLEDEVEELLYSCSILFEKLLRRGFDVNLIYEAISWSLNINKHEDFRNLAYTKLMQLVGTALARVNLLNKFDRIERDEVLNSLKCELLSLKSFSSLSYSLQKYLPKLSVTAAFVILKTESIKSRFVSGFDRNTIYDKAIEFDEDLILPEQISENIGPGVYVVSSLYSENNEIGYLVLRSDSHDGPLCEEIRTSLSSAVQGTYLLESSNKARILAENAEKARNEFFSNVSEDLRDPLIRIKNLIASIPMDEEYRKAVDKEIGTANHMLDLSLAQTGELEIEPYLLSLSLVAEEIASELGVRIEICDEIPLIYFDRIRLREALELLISLSRSNGCDVSMKIISGKSGPELSIISDGMLDYTLLLNDSSFLLSERIMVMHQGSLSAHVGELDLSFAIPTFSLESAKIADKKLLILSDGMILPFYDRMMERKDAFRSRNDAKEIGAVCWRIGDDGYDVLSILRSLSRDSSASRIPLYFYGTPDGDYSPLSLVDSMIRDFDTPPVLILGPLPESMKKILSEKNTIDISTLDEYERADRERRARLLIITKEISAKEIIEFRKNHDVNFNIIVMLGTFSAEYANSLCPVPKLILVNSCIAESDDFIARFNSLLAGSEILPTFTGAIVKKTLGYLLDHATSQLTRWQLAESVNVSEDYLTRIFRKEIGLSPWDYLNRYRIYLASEMLRQEAMSVNEVAYRTGFQDQAYFCRVFKKIKGMTPGKMRNRL